MYYFGTAPDIMIGIGCNFLCNCSKSHLLHYGQYKLLSQMAPHYFISVKPASWIRSISQVSLHVGYSSWPLPSRISRIMINRFQSATVGLIIQTKQKLQLYLEQVQNRSYIHTRYQEAKTVSYHCGVVVYYIIYRWTYYFTQTH